MTMSVCSRCEGKRLVACNNCDGKGDMYFVPVLDIWESDCSDCHGSGVVMCPSCHGRGFTQSEVVIGPDLRHEKAARLLL